MAECVFQGIKKPIIYQNNQHYDHVINRWAAFIRKQHRKGLIPLFITGLGVSKSGDNEIPDVYGIVREFETKFKSRGNDKKKLPEIEELFKILWELREKEQKDRGTVARLLNTFQERQELREEWKSVNKWLLKAIICAKPTNFHEKLAELYEKFNAVNITLNFDGLLIRELNNRIMQRNESDGKETERKESAFSLPTREECESFFLRLGDTKKKEDKEDKEKEYLEIQIRGDILYVICDSKGFCPQKDKLRPLWSSFTSYTQNKKTENGKTRFLFQTSDEDELEKLVEIIRKCPSCGKEGVSYLSFPGSYEKEKDMKNMLEIVWKYLAFKVGSVTVVGTSCEWDPLIVAFLGDLLSERKIPLLVVDNAPKENGGYKYIIQELVNTEIRDAKSVCVNADQFMENLTEELRKNILVENVNIKHDGGVTDDEYWLEVGKKDNDLNKSINREFSALENKLRNRLKEENLHCFAQLGLKSYWLGIPEHSDKAKYHTRFNHSIGVMKVASYLYEKALTNAGLINEVPPSEKQFLRLAALLHDVGHLPFSHLIENVFNELNWKPAGYKDHYSHVFQTDKEIEEIFSNDNLRVQLENTGYNVQDIINLVNGSFGVEYLDAIINSSIDADKIDYVFRDTSSTNRKTSLVPAQFLKDIVNGLSVTPEKYLSFSGVSAMAAVGLLRERQRLYRSLYLQPGIVVLEGIVKLIIKTFFVHYIELGDVKIIEKMKPSNNDYPDLGEYKISYCVKKLQKIFNEVKENKKNDNTMYEIKIVEKMFEKIKIRENILGENFSKNIKKGFNTVYNIKSEGGLKALENKIRHKRFNIQRGKIEKIKEIVRDVMFRMPGAAIIEVSTLPKFLSSSDNRGKRERSDGTKTFSECILVPTNDYNAWNPNDNATVTIHNSRLNDKKENIVFVYMYPLSDNPDNDSYYQYTLNLFDKLLAENSISEIDKNGQRNENRQY